MGFTREELDWLEAEWAFHLHGRSAFLSREDFLCLQAWSEQEIPAQTIVNAMASFFARRAQRARPRSFITMSHLEKDVEKALQYQTRLQQSGVKCVDLADWEGVRSPLKEEPAAKSAFEHWKRLRDQVPAPDHPGYLEHFDAERLAFRQLVALAENALGAQAHTLAQSLQARLQEAGMLPDTLVWKRAWEHHWSRWVCEQWHIPLS